MTRFKRLTINGLKYIYSFNTLDGEGTFSINSADFSLQLIEKKCYLENQEMDQDNLNKILFIGKKKIIENNFPESCIYATH